MAHINIGDFISIGMDFNGHTATSYIVAKDEEFTKIIDQSIFDTQNLYRWHTPLPKLPEDGEGFYKDLSELHAKIRIHAGEKASPWITLDLANQNKQDVIITEDYRKEIFTTSDAIGMQ